MITNLDKSCSCIIKKYLQNTFLSSGHDYPLFLSRLNQISDIKWDRFDICIVELFYVCQNPMLLISQEVDSNSLSTEPSTSTYPIFNK